MIAPTDGIETLRRLGIPVRIHGPASISLRIHDRWLDASIITRQQPLTSSHLHSLRGTPGNRPDEIAIFIVPRLTPGGRRTIDQMKGIGLIAVEDGVAIINGKELRIEQRSSTTQPPSPQRRRPWGRYAVIRCLLRTPRPRSQVELARESGVTQPAVSQALKAIDHAVRTGSGWVTSHPEELWDSFMADYPGPGGISTHWYGMAPPVIQIERAQQIDPRTLVTGDVAADALAPWRKPRSAVLYGRTGIDLSQTGFAPSSSVNATLEHIVPADHTIWSTAQAWFSGGARGGFADPVITAWDVRRSGGPDVDEAAHRLQRSVLRAWR